MPSDAFGEGRITTRLTCCLWAQNLSLDTLIADAIPTLLPNLRQLRITRCELTVAAADSLLSTACTSLQHVEVDWLYGERTHLTIQLQQLGGLRSLTSVSLDETCPTLFLNTLGTRLTALHLDECCGEVDPDTYTPTPVWRATLQHVACCTALQSLAMPCDTAEELGLVAPALQQLRRLHLNGPGVAVDGDAVVERLLGLPHLTSLRWEDISQHSLQRSHAGSPCHWRELSFGCVSPHQLARLPFHSLTTSPVSWDTIVVHHRTSVAEVQAAVDSVARRCPVGGVWKTQGTEWPKVQFSAAEHGAFSRGVGEGDAPPALLRALRPLLAAPGLRQLEVTHLTWDVELARVLGEVLPRTCTALGLSLGSASLPACVELAVSFPWVQTLHLIYMSMHPQGVTAYIAAAAGRVHGTGVGPVLRSVVVRRPERPEGRTKESWREAWEDVRQAARGLGVGVELELQG